MKNLLFIISLCLFVSLSHAQDFCPGNIFTNGDLENGTPTPGHQDINQAAGFQAIWATGSLADYYAFNASPFTAKPQPPTGNYAGFWVSNSAGNTTYREGLMNQLTTPLAPNSGYAFSFDLACLGGWGQGELAVYGIHNPTNAFSVTPNSSHDPINEGLFGASNTLEIGKIFLDNTCDLNKTNHTLSFSPASSGFTQTITHILLTHSNDTISGARYIGVDNFCMAFDPNFPPQECAEMVKDSVTCLTDGTVALSFDIQNNTSNTYSSYEIYQLPVAGAPILQSSTTVGPYGIVGRIHLNLDPAQGAVQCFQVNLTAGDDMCCHFEFCIDLPDCYPCDDIDITENTLDSLGDCCYSLDVTNNFQANYFTKIKSRITTSGVTFTNVQANNSWNVLPSSNTATWTPPGGYVPLGVSTSTFDFCLDGVIFSSQLPQEIIFDWIVTDAAGIDSVACSDTLYFNCSSCLLIEEHEVSCLSTGDYQYNLTLQNNSSQNITSVRYEVISPSGVCLNNTSSPIIQLPAVGAPVPPTGFFSETLTLNSCTTPLTAGMMIGIKLVLFDSDAPNWCCHDTVWITLPECPTSCPCDELEADVNQGFQAQFDCPDGKFTPLALTSCDEVYWFINNQYVGTSSGNATFVYTYPGPGTYEVCMNVIRYDSNGEVCEYMYCKTLDIFNWCISDPWIGVGTNPVRVNPSLVQDIVTIGIEIGSIKHIQVIDLQGKVVFNESKLNLQEKTINLSNLNSGIYFVKVLTDEGEQSTHKIVKQE